MGAGAAHRQVVSRWVSPYVGACTKVGVQGKIAAGAAGTRVAGLHEAAAFRHGHEVARERLLLLLVLSVGRRGCSCMELGCTLRVVLVALYHPAYLWEVAVVKAHGDDAGVTQPPAQQGPPGLVADGPGSPGHKDDGWQRVTL